jgi:hypothetical protein
MEAYVRNRDDPDPDLSMAQCVVAFDGSGHMTPESDEAGLDKVTHRHTHHTDTHTHTHTMVPTPR